MADPFVIEQEASASGGRDPFEIEGSTFAAAPSAEKREVGLGEAARRMVRGGYEAAKEFPGAVATGLAERLYQGQTALNERMGWGAPADVPALIDRLMQSRATRQAREAAALQPGETASPLAAGMIQAGPEIGRMIPEMAGGIMAAARVPIQKSASVLSNIMQEGARGMYAMSPTAARTGEERRAELEAAGASPEEAALGGAATQTMMMGQGFAPASVPGRLGARAVSGGTVNVVPAIAQQQAENAIARGLGVPEVQRDPFSPEVWGPGAVMGSTIGAGLGPRPLPKVVKPEVRAGYERAAAQDAAAAELVDANFDRFRPMLEANGITDPRDPRAPGAIRSLLQREQRRAAQPAETGAEQAPTPPEQVPVIRERPEVVNVDERGRAINPTARGDIYGALSTEGTRAAGETASRRAFDVAQVQAARKAAGEAEGLDVREVRAGGTASEAGTVATAPEAFTFLDVQRSKAGKVIGTGPQVEVVGEVPVVGRDGTEQTHLAIRYEDARGEIVNEVVPPERVSSLERPTAPRFAQDIEQTTYAPPRGVGTGEQQPLPRRAAQRITTGMEAEDAGPLRGDEGPVPPERDVIGRGQDEGGQDFQRQPREGRGPGIEAREGFGGGRGPQGNAQRVEPPWGAIREEPTPPPIEQQPLDYPPQPRAEVPEEPPWMTPAEARSPQQDAPALRNMAEGAYWSEVGGRLLREDAADRLSPVAGRTAWTPAQEWFAEMRRALGRNGLSQQAEIRAAVEKYARGEAMSAKERRTVEWMRERMNEEIRDAEQAAEWQGVPREELDIVDLSSRAAELDEAAFDAAVRKYEGDDAGFLREVRRIIDERPEQGEAVGRGGEDVGEAAQGTEGRPEFGLEQPTEAGLRERAAADERAAAERARVENAPPPEEFTLTGSDRTADQAIARGQQELSMEMPRGDQAAYRAWRAEQIRDNGASVFREVGPNQHGAFTLDGRQVGTFEITTPRRSGSQGQLYSGIPLDKMAQAIADAWGWARGDADGWTANIGRFAQALADGGLKPVRQVVSWLLDTATGHLRSILKGATSETANTVLNWFNEKAGKGEGIGRTYAEATEAMRTRWINRVAKALEPHVESPERMKQIVAMVRSGNFDPNTGMGRAAAVVRDTLKEAFDYMREAGVDIGEQQRYFPREIDYEAVKNDIQGFRRAAEQAYREAGASNPEAAARALEEAVLYQGLDTVYDAEFGKPVAKFVKNRIFGREVDNASHPFNKFLHNDPTVMLPKYFERAARRAEFVRRMGEDGAKWEEMRSKMIEEGLSADQIAAVRTYLQLGFGMRRAGSAGAFKGASAVRTWVTLMLMERATLTSLSEFVIPAIRAAQGNPFKMLSNSARSLKTTIQALAKKGTARDLIEIGEDIGLIGSSWMDTMNANRFAGGEALGKTQAKVVDTFFRRTGLTQWTEATRVGGLDVGRVFIRRMAKRMQEGDRLSRRFLAELGVPEDKAQGFADWLMRQDDGFPSLDALRRGGENAELWKTAAMRFVRQSIMHANQTLRPQWASTPVGSVIAQLQSFNYAFFENVWKRNMRMAGDALSTKTDYTAMERMRLLQPLLMMPTVVAVAAAIGELRDEIFSDPERRAEETLETKAIKAASRGAPFAPVDPIINWLTGARYMRGSAESLSGPGIGKTIRFLDSLASYLANNSERTTSAERKLAKEFYDLVLEPAANLMISLAPGSSTAAVLGKAAATQAVGAGTTREEAFVKPLAGEAERFKAKRSSGREGRGGDRGARSSGRE